MRLFFSVLTIPAILATKTDEHVVHEYLEVRESLSQMNDGTNILEPFPVDMGIHMQRLVAEQYLREWNGGYPQILKGILGRSDPKVEYRRTLQKLENSVSVLIKNTPDVVVSYFSNCKNPSDLHPAIKNHLFHSLLEESRTVPRLWFVSPPVRFANRPNAVRAEIDFENIEAECAASSDATVRVVVRDRFGLLYNEMIKRYSGSFFLTATAAAIKQLEKMHSIGVYHGDVGPHSVLLRPPSIDSYEATRFTHFDKAGFLDETAFPNAPETTNGLLHSVYSHKGAEDDVYKMVVLAVLFLLHVPETEMLFVSRAMTEKEGFSYFQRIIDTAPVRDSARGLLGDKIVKVWRTVRTLNSRKAPIPYDFLYGELRGLGSLFDTLNHFVWPDNGPAVDVLPTENIGDDFLSQVVPFLASEQSNPCKYFNMHENFRLAEAEGSEFESFLFNRAVTDLARWRNRKLIPRLYHAFDYIQLEGQEMLIKLKLGKKLGNTVHGMSNVFRVANRPEWVIKYQSNCEYATQPHPLLRDFFFLKRLEHLGVAPKAIFLSLPTKLTAPMSPKTHFTTPRGVMEKECLLYRLDAHVRFMVMESAISTLAEVQVSYYSRRLNVPLGESIQIMISALTSLELIHKAGVVHRDIHSGNIAILPGIDSRIGFIDFGRSKLVTSQFFSTRKERIYPSLSRLHVQYSPFEIDGFEPSFRDDVYRVLEIGSSMIVGPGALYSHMQSLSPRELFEFKRNGDFYSATPTARAADRLDSLPGLTKEDIWTLRDSLRRAVNMARTVESVERMPHYAGITKHLKDALRLVLKSKMH